MSSPQETTSDGTRKNFEQITFRFCSECSNMLYPKEDPDSHKLQFTCRTCQYTEEATSTCVFRNVMNNAVGETAGVTQDVGSDPTVSSPSPDVYLPVICQRGALQAGHTSGNLSGGYTGEYLAADVQPSIAGAQNASTSTTIQDADNQNTATHFYPVDPDLVGTIRSVIATSIYNCVDPEIQASMDHVYIKNLVLDMAFSLPPSWNPACWCENLLEEEDADPPEALGEEHYDAGLEH